MTKLPYITTKGRIVNIHANETAFEWYVMKSIGIKLSMVILSTSLRFDVSN